MLMDLLIIIILSYFIGSIPFGLILTYFFGYGDIRNIGSGNIGATNALRTGNKSLAILVLFLDFIKGLIPVTICIILFKNYYNNYLLLFGLCSILGHCYPLWLNFKGGKGVATSLGVFFAVSYFIGLLFIFVWIINFIFSKKSSYSALVSFLSLPLPSLIILGKYEFAFSLIIVFIIFVKHKENIFRLLKNKEGKITL
tara:strand:- start:526 stop:1119 length:594 start_codon:yes stop_codon:yes gene_type:complete